MLDALLISIEKHAGRNAFCIEGKLYTYRELRQRVQGIVEAIRQSGGSRTRRIGIVTTNTIETYASILACWCCGCAYIPVSPGLPAQRNEYNGEQAQIDVLLSSTPDTSAIIPANDRMRMIHTGALASSDNRLTAAPMADADVLYILFTSGSTGVPKGVPINYANVCAFIDSYEALGFRCNEEDRFLQMFELTFDVSVASYLIPLLMGACVYTVASEGIKYMNVYKVLRDHKITFASIVPSIINYLKPYFKDIKLPELRYCILTAEASILEYVQKWMECIPAAEVVNLYGPTEATIWCTGYTLRKEEPKAYNGMLGIGRAFKQVEAFILDESGNETAVGEKGELCIASAQLTTGYLNNPERTASAFITRQGKRLYKTGDLCYKDDSGDILYCGRIDHQVKIQGFRIELNEIEAVAKELMSVNNVAVVYKNKLGVDQICLFLEKYPGEMGGVKKQLEQKLPYYMIPTQVRIIEQFPHNASSKVDRVTLSKIATEYEH